MAKLSQKTMDRLIRIMKDERSEERCILVQGYKKEAEILTHEHDSEIERHTVEIKRLMGFVDTQNMLKSQCIEEKDELLKENNLLNFNTSYGTCDLGGKPLQLEAFDIKTRNMEKEILER